MFSWPKAIIHIITSHELLSVFRLRMSLILSQCLSFYCDTIVWMGAWYLNSKYIILMIEPWSFQIWHRNLCELILSGWKTWSKSASLSTFCRKNSKSGLKVTNGHQFISTPNITYGRYRCLFKPNMNQIGQIV